MGAYIYGFSLLVSWKNFHKCSSIKGVFGMNCVPHKNPQCLARWSPYFPYFLIFFFFFSYFKICSVSFLIFPGDDAQIARNETWVLSRSSEKIYAYSEWQPEKIHWILLHNFLHLNTRLVILKFCLVFAWSQSLVWCHTSENSQSSIQQPLIIPTN